MMRRGERWGRGGESSAGRCGRGKEIERGRAGIISRRARRGGEIEAGRLYYQARGQEFGRGEKPRFFGHDGGVGDPRVLNFSP